MMQPNYLDNAYANIHKRVTVRYDGDKYFIVKRVSDTGICELYYESKETALAAYRMMLELK